jgi:hypothetical protein
MQHSTQKTVLILVNGPHKPPMIQLKKWLEQHLPDFRYQICSQFLFGWKIRQLQPQAIITYNKNLYTPTTVKALINYTNNGGRLIALHHNISSMMLRRPEWLNFCQIEIIRGPGVEYPWSVIEGGDLYLYNLAPRHPVTTDGISYPDKEIGRAHV